jgi:hypothetical protein
MESGDHWASLGYRDDTARLVALHERLSQPAPAPSAPVVDRYSMEVVHDPCKPYVHGRLDPEGRWCLFNDVAALAAQPAPAPVQRHLTREQLIPLLNVAHRELDRVMALIDECFAASEAPAPVQPCSLGVGCEEAGKCYAVANGHPEQCGAFSPAPAQPSGGELPPLPAFAAGNGGIGYSIAQMHDYARAAIAALAQQPGGGDALVEAARYVVADMAMATPRVSGTVSQELVFDWRERLIDALAQQPGAQSRTPAGGA